MNYKHHYDLLINRAKIRELKCYKERHHIVPRCMGGDDSPKNLVYLTAEEHYVAHLLLIKIYPSENKLVIAAFRMTPKHLRRNKEYGVFRKKLAASLSTFSKGRIISPETRLKLREAHSARLRSYWDSEEHRKLISDKMRGNKYGLGTKKSKEAIERTAAAHRGKKLTDEQRAKIAASRKGKKLSVETKAKISASLMGNKRNFGNRASPEAVANMCAAQRARPKRGPLSEETKAKLSITKTGKKHSPESRAKMSAAKKGKPHSPEHRANLAAANRARWHKTKAQSSFANIV